MNHDSQNSQKEKVTLSKRKAKARRSGQSVLDKAKALGAMADVYSLAVYWEPTHKEYRLAVHVPDGWDLPDVNELINAALSGRTQHRLRHGAHQTSSEPLHQPVHRIRKATTGQRQAMMRRSARQRDRRSTRQSSYAVTPDENTPRSADQAPDGAGLLSPSCSPATDPAGQNELPPWRPCEGNGQHAAEPPAVAADGALSVGLGAVSPRLLVWPPPAQQAQFHIEGYATVQRAAMAATDGTGQCGIVEVSARISAKDHSNGAPVGLTDRPWKSKAPDRDPPAEQDGFPCLRFRSITENNGRMRGMQKRFVVQLNIHATLTGGSDVVFEEYTTAPIVVRGGPGSILAGASQPEVNSEESTRQVYLIESKACLPIYSYRSDPSRCQAHFRLPATTHGEDMIRRLNKAAV